MSEKKYLTVVFEIDSKEEGDAILERQDYAFASFSNALQTLDERNQLLLRLKLAGASLLDSSEYMLDKDYTQTVKMINEMKFGNGTLMRPENPRKRLPGSRNNFMNGFSELSNAVHAAGLHNCPVHMFAKAFTPKWREK